MQLNMPSPRSVALQGSPVSCSYRIPVLNLHKVSCRSTSLKQDLQSTFKSAKGLCNRQKEHVLRGNVMTVGATKSDAAATSSNGGGGATVVYQALSAIHGVLGAVLFFLPHVILAKLLPAVVTTQLLAYETLLCQQLGASFMLSAVILSCLKEAVEHARMGSATYQTLIWGCVLRIVGWVVGYFTAQMSLDPLLIGTVVALAAVELPTHFGILASLGAERKAPALFIPTKIPTLLYALLALALCVAAGTKYTPGTAGLGGYLAVLSASFLVQHASAALVLMDAANRSRLGASTFKHLNLGFGFFLAAGSFLAVSQYPHTTMVKSIPMNVFSNACLALFCLYNFWFQKK